MERKKRLRKIISKSMEEEMSTHQHHHAEKEISSGPEQSVENLADGVTKPQSESPRLGMRKRRTSVTDLLSMDFKRKKPAEESKSSKNTTTTAVDSKDKKTPSQQESVVIKQEGKENYYHPRDSSRSSSDVRHREDPSHHPSKEEASRSNDRSKERDSGRDREREREKEREHDRDKDRNRDKDRDMGRDRDRDRERRDGDREKDRDRDRDRDRGRDGDKDRDRDRDRDRGNRDRDRDTNRDKDRDKDRDRDSNRDRDRERQSERTPGSDSISKERYRERDYSRHDRDRDRDRERDRDRDRERERDRERDRNPDRNTNGRAGEGQRGWGESNGSGRHTGSKGDYYFSGDASNSWDAPPPPLQQQQLPPPHQQPDWQRKGSNGNATQYATPPPYRSEDSRSWNAPAPYTNGPYHGNAETMNPSYPPSWYGDRSERMPDMNYNAPPSRYYAPMHPTTDTYIPPSSAAPPISQSYHPHPQEWGAQQYPNTQQAQHQPPHMMMGHSGGIYGTERDSQSRERRDPRLRVKLEENRGPPSPPRSMERGAYSRGNYSRT